MVGGGWRVGDRGVDRVGIEWVEVGTEDGGEHDDREDDQADDGALVPFELPPDVLAK
jgi:hypothetical protein